jgi:hypothetical protein
MNPVALQGSLLAVFLKVDKLSTIFPAKHDRNLVLMNIDNLACKLDSSMQAWITGN